MKAALSLLPFFFALSAVSATPASNQRRDDVWTQLKLPGTNYIPKTNSGISPSSIDPSLTSTDAKNEAEKYCAKHGCQGFAYWSGEDLVYHNGKTTENWSAQIVEDDLITSSTDLVWTWMFFNYTITPEDFMPAPTNRPVKNAAAYTK